MSKSVSPVLIIDPHDVITKAMSGMLAEIGWTKLETVSNAVDALEQLRKNAYALVLTDWVMEPMDGLEFLRLLRADAALAATPVMIVTADPNPAHFIAAKEAGANAYALAPFSTDVLAAKLDRIAWAA